MNPINIIARASFVTCALLSVAASPVTVSITFDDAYVSQSQMISLLKQYNLVATFYINAPRIGTPKYLSREQLDQMIADGHEIGGHSIHHLRMETASFEEQVRQLCLDREILLTMTDSVRSFAYPFSSFNEDTKRAARFCGYNSARAVGGLVSDQCTDCATGEDQFNPPDLFGLRTPGSVRNTTTAEIMRQQVLRAAAGDSTSNWVILVGHHVCDDCENYLFGTTPTEFREFFAWLEAESQAGRVIVRTVGDVIGGENKPVVQGPVASVQSGNLLQNPSFEQFGFRIEATDADEDVTPHCWQQRGDQAGRVWKVIKTGTLTGTAAVQASSTTHGPRISTREDLGECSPPIMPNHSYKVLFNYKATSSVRITTLGRDENNRWRTLERSPEFPAQADYAEGSWTSAPMPASIYAMGVMISMDSPGTITVDDVTLLDQGAESKPGCSHIEGTSKSPPWYSIVLLLSLLIVWKYRRRNNNNATHSKY